MDDNVEDCPVCLITFDDTLRRPRTLPCGHAFCTVCIDGLKEQGEVNCPTCRVRHALPRAGQFPVAYTVEGLIRRLKGAALASVPPKPGKDTAAPPLNQPAQKMMPGLSRKTQSMLQEQEAEVLAAIHTCQEVQAQLHQYCTTLAGWDDRQQQIEDELQALVDQSKSARLLVNQEKVEAVAKKEEVHQGEQQLHAMLQALRTAATQQESYQVIEDADRHTEEKSQRAKECLARFPDGHTITTMIKVREASETALEAATTIQAAQDTASSPGGGGGACYSGLQTAAASSIMDRLKTLLLPSSLKVEDLRSLTQTARNLLQAGLVFAVHDVEGQNRHARISLQDDRLYLHSLQDQLLPPQAVTVQMDEVVCASPPCQVFLDLQWPGRGPGRLVVHLSQDTARGRHFLWLCTGQRGPSYLNTKMHKVEIEGKPGEFVVGGDYEGKDGNGGATLLPDLDNTGCRNSGEAGAVFGGGGNAVAALFAIITRERNDGGVFGGMFGQVVEGLEMVVEAAKHRPITEVTVVECGVVLWQH